jgi:hypothetical protein
MIILHHASWAILQVVSICRTYPAQLARGLNKETNKALFTWAVNPESRSKRGLMHHAKSLVQSIKSVSRALYRFAAFLAHRSATGKKNPRLVGSARQQQNPAAERRELSATPPSCSSGEQGRDHARIRA